MNTIEVDKNIMYAAVYGGAILGCGGGGKIQDGLARGKLALSRGQVKIVPLDYLEYDDIIITASSVGSPKSPNRYIENDYYVKATEIFLKRHESPIRGIVSSENGAAASVNGWLQAASLDLYVVDAPCNGHAHPTGNMGSMGLHKLKDYLACEAVVGGNKEQSKYFEYYSEGNIASISALSRYAATIAGGVVAVARNPVTVSYAYKNAAVGGLSYAIEIGKLVLSHKNQPRRLLDAVCNYMQGEIITKGRINKIVMNTKNALDIGSVTIEDNKCLYDISILNEFMSIESSGERLATFPDMIALLNTETGLPVCSADLTEDLKVAVLVVKKEDMPLGSGMYYPDLYVPLEELLGIELRKFIF